MEKPVFDRKVYTIKLVTSPGYSGKQKIWGYRIDGPGLCHMAAEFKSASSALISAADAINKASGR